MEYRYWIMVAMLLTVEGLASDTDVIVRIEQGLIRGTILRSIRSNQTYYGFMGIPYAKPPIGTLRFMRAQPPESWSEIKNVTKNGNICPQFGQFINDTKYYGEEDCLYINVYTPELPHESNLVRLAVMVWIHGGEFLYGSGDRDMYGPDYFIDEGVILVTLNYRLGILGFLSLQNEIVPGNTGLKDQVLALHWVKKNINKFGGDPNKITIFGESAGGASVHYHLLSPLSRGLFNSAISQSGSALQPWAFQTPESCLSLAFDLAEHFGNKTIDPTEVLKILMMVKPKDFIKYTIAHHFEPRMGPLVGPTLDTKDHSNQVFLPDIPINIIDSGKFFRGPYITGMNSEEAILFAKALKKYVLLLLPVATIFRFVLPYYVGQSIPEASKMANEVKSKYFSVSKPFVLKYIDVLTDMYFGNGIYCTALKQAKDSTVYSYEFSFNGTANVIKKFSDGEDFPGACHADELPYMFTFSLLNVTIKRRTQEYITSRRLVRLWTNFAKFGNPTPKPEPLLQNMTWYPVNQSNFLYLNIDSELSIKKNLNNGNGLWWQQLYNNFTTGVSPCWTAH